MIYYFVVVRVDLKRSTHPSGKKKVYLNNGKYGHYLNHDGKNYKVPEWFPVDKFDVDIAERLIEYKKKMSEMYCDESSKKTKPTKQDESESEEETPKQTKTKK